MGILIKPSGREVRLLLRGFLAIDESTSTFIIYSTARKTLVCIFFVVVVVCSRESVDNRSMVTIVDAIDLFSLDEKAYIQSTYNFPNGIFVLVRTIDKLNYNEIGSYATDAMEREDFWNQIRPKGFFAKWITQDKPWSRGVYVLISKDPSLIQIRYGERIRLEAYRSGLASGAKYLEIQRYFERHGPTLGTLNALRVLSQELPPALNLPWHLHYGKWLVCVAFSEFEELVSPSDGMYTNVLLKPYLKIVESLGGFLSTANFLSVNFFLYVSVKAFALYSCGVIRRKTKRATGARWKMVTLVVIGVFFLVVTGVFSFPFLGGVILLNNGRLEDNLALQQLGIHLPPQTPLDLHWFVDVTGLWLAILIGWVNLTNLKVEDPAREPRTLYHTGLLDMDILQRLSSMYPYPMSASAKWRCRKTGERTYLISCHNRKYRLRYSMIVIMLFMPLAIGLVAVLQELFNLANNVISNKLDSVAVHDGEQE